MAQSNLEEVLRTSMEKFKSLVDANTVIGNAITTPDGTIIIPVSKVSFGFASGGSDLPTAKPKDLFSGGGGGGGTIQPVAFLVISNGEVRLLQMEKFNDSLDRAISMVPEVIDKVSGFFHKEEKPSPAPKAPV